MGLVVSVKAEALPLQPLAVGVTAIVAVPADVGVSAAILPEPLAAKPIEVLLFVDQLKVVLATLLGELKVIGLKLDPKQMVWLAPPETVGKGFTVIVKVCAGPAQEPKNGVTVMVAVTFELVLLVGLNAAIVPLPEPTKLMDVVVFVQLYVMPVEGELVKAIAGCTTPGQTVRSAGSVKVILGLTVIVIVCVFVHEPSAAAEVA